MKCQKSCGPRLGRLVYQLLGVINFAYDLRFRHMIARWKAQSQKTFIWALKMAPEVKTAKNIKLPKLPENCFDPVGKGGWPLHPPGSIIHP